MSRSIVKEKIYYQETSQLLGAYLFCWEKSKSRNSFIIMSMYCAGTGLLFYGTTFFIMNIKSTVLSGTYNFYYHGLGLHIFKEYIIRSMSIMYRDNSVSKKHFIPRTTSIF